MIVYILKTVVCSAFFLGIYYLLLEKAKMARFNRAYLLLALIASFSIPLITFTTRVVIFPVLQESTAMPAIQEVPPEVTPAGYVRPDLTLFILQITYLLITVLLLARFIRNIARLIILIGQNASFKTGYTRIILLRECVVPFSFFNYVFINEREYASGRIEPEVMHHEMEHGRQLHTLDIIFIELLKAIAWFNPLLVLYRKAIQLNHEFLADDAVVTRFNDPVSYQLLLVNRISQTNRFSIVTSPFSYKITKKRLVMITNPFNRKANLARALAIIPAMALAVVLFSEKVVAQVAAPSVDRKKSTETVQQPVTVFASGDTAQKPGKVFASPMYGGTKEGVSQELLNEYQQLVESRKYLDGKGNGSYKGFTPDEIKRMKEIFSKMNRGQQTAQQVTFYAPMEPFAKAVPTVTQVQAFLDAGKYGVWIDNKKVANTSLENYKNTDFSHVTVSKLYGKAKEGRSYTHQVDLMTNSRFEKMNARIIANREPVMVLMVRKKDAQ